MPDLGGVARAAGAGSGPAWPRGAGGAGGDAVGPATRPSKPAQLPKPDRRESVREVEHDIQARFPKPPARSWLWEVEHAFRVSGPANAPLPRARRSGAPLRPDLPRPERAGRRLKADDGRATKRQTLAQHTRGVCSSAYEMRFRAPGEFCDSITTVLNFPSAGSGRGFGDLSMLFWGSHAGFVGRAGAAGATSAPRSGGAAGRRQLRSVVGGGAAGAAYLCPKYGARPAPRPPQPEARTAPAAKPTTAVLPRDQPSPPYRKIRPTVAQQRASARHPAPPPRRSTHPHR